MAKSLVDDLGNIVSPENSKGKPEYAKLLESARDKDECPFCNPEIWENQPIKRGLHWFLKCNDFPYKHHLFHFVVIFRKHTNDVADVDAIAWAELGEILQWATKEFNLPGGGLALRFGLAEFNASTIRHLHAHIQVPDLTGPSKATFAKDPKK